MNKKRVIIALFFLMIAIILGAFGAHGLKSLISPEKITSFEVGIRYQMYVGLILLILGLNENKFNFSLRLVSNLLVLGGILFSISIYIPSLQELTSMSLKFFGPITPLGGSLMIVSLVILMFKLAKN